MENKMMPMMDPALNGTPGDLPMEDTLCVFKFTLPRGEKNIPMFILGSLTFLEKDKGFFVKQYGGNDYIRAGKFTHYQPVANENGGFYFINKK